MTSVSRASFHEKTNNTPATTTIVSAWMKNCAMPSWRSCWRTSMSLVIRVMITPAFSSVK